MSVPPHMSKFVTEFSPVGPDALRSQPNGFSFEADDIGRIKIWGFWTIEIADAYFQHLTLFLQAHRSIGSGASILIDLTGADTQAQTVIKRTEEGNISAFDNHDRVAIVTSSSLLKMQIGRTGVGSSTKVFASSDDALAWLRA